LRRERERLKRMERWVGTGNGGKRGGVVKEERGG